MALPVVAIVGRPNVGKSTLFNRLVGFKKSLVHDRPGVTRDRLYERTEQLGRRFLLVDTGGLEPVPSDDMLKGMRKQALVAVEEADVIVFLVDGRTGWTPADDLVADLLRRSHKPVVLTVNKIDGPRHEELTADFWQVGILPLIAVSAEHGRGMYELCEAIVERLPAPGPEELALAEEEADEPEEEPFPDESEDEDDGEGTDEVESADDGAEDDGADDELVDLEGEEFEPPPVVGLEDQPDAIAVAVIGRPNIGKSTLVNRLLGEERMLVHDAPGTTMDPVDSLLDVDGRKYVLVDTAGVRRKARIEDAVERFVSLRSIQSIERCHVCLLMIDATVGITDQDAKLAQLVVDRGRAVILLFNKWDVAKDLEDVDSKRVEREIEQKLPHVTWAPHLFVSAKTGKGLHRVLPLVDSVYAEFNRHLGTPEVNRFLARVVATHTPPQRHHRPVRLYFAAQTRVRPPTFVFWSNTPEGVVPSYKAYLSNRMRTEYGFQGTPLKLHFRKRRKIGE